MSLNPARLLGLPGGTLEIGKPADLVLIDPDRTWKVDAGNLKSKSYNTPLDGVELYGVATHCFVQGRLRFEVAAR
jgi:dihydroorotase